VAGGVAAIVVVAAYPALWVAPVAELHALRRSAGLAGEGHATYFRGETTSTPGPAFYLVALPLRATPWFLASAAVALVAVWRGPTRGHGLALACMGLPPLVVLSLASKQLDRYGLPVLVVGAVAVGIVVASAVERVGRRAPASAAPAAAAALALVAGAHALLVAPYGLAYFNPALGGTDTAMETVLVGWGEGLEEVGPIVAERQGGDCASVTIHAPWTSRPYPCGRPPVAGGAPPTYVAAYVSDRQRYPAGVANRIAGRPLVATIRHGGVTYVELYGPRQPAVDDAAHPE
jgi:hypothetical protein